MPATGIVTGVLRTVSLRRRVTWTALAVVGVVLIGVVLVVHALFGVVVNRGVNAVLADRVQLAQQLARQNVGPAVLIERVDARSVRARLVLPDGQTYGSLSPARLADPRVKRRQVRLHGAARLNGAVLTLAAESTLLSGAQSRLLWVLVATGVGALLVTAAALLVGVRRALAPLDAMTALAGRIAQGSRGGRLSPARADTELGRTAAAFDAMLEALEGAEAHALASEERTRRFVTDAAHELRTPIAGIAAAAEAVLHQAEGADVEQRQRLELLLVRESHRAARLVDDLVNLARLDAGVELRRSPVELRRLVTTQADRVRVLHPALTIAVRGEAQVVDADAPRVTEILANLLDNACQATPAGGRVEVRVGRNDEVTEFAEVTVADTGPGVPPPDRERIFDRLVRLDPARDHQAGGSGLGLAIARGLARAHGGDLHCQPPPGATGAVFQLLLPISDNDTHSIPPPPSQP
ncbi:MAG TPA: HAMP domain-containing sensor histidine kinase [Pseudonocardiaceae bacterium]